MFSFIFSTLLLTQTQSNDRFWFNGDGVYVNSSGDTEDSNERGGQKGGQKSGQKKGEKTIDTILQLINDNPSITRKVLVQTVGISPSAIQKHINRLKTDGIIVRHGGDRGGYWEFRE